jgi:hypothetical protein
MRTSAAKAVTARTVASMGFSVRAFLVNDRGDLERFSLAAGSMDLPALVPDPDQLIRAEHVFHRRQYQGEFSWVPSRAQEQSLVRLITEQGRRRPPR